MFNLALIYLLCVAGNLLGDELYKNYGVDISYEDLKEMNVSCFPLDTCMEKRSSDSPGIEYPYACSCDSQCFMLDTCCVDAPYRNTPPPMQKCRSPEIPSVNDCGYYMVQKCPNNTDINPVWKYLCEKQWDGEDDILMVAPVSSLDTSTTYKNYYCFRCHESSNDVLYWNLRILGTYRYSTEFFESEEYNVTYSDDSKSWVATAGEESMPVYLQFLPPEHLPISQKWCCDIKLISDCSDSWTDKYIRDKCSAYTAILYGRRGFGWKYKNVHCALCNFEYINETSCYSWRPQYSYTFTFVHIIKVNKNEEESAKCAEGSHWNPYFRECKEITCAVEGNIIKGGRCVHP